MNLNYFMLKIRKSLRSSDDDPIIWNVCSPYLQGRTGKLLDAGCGCGNNLAKLMERPRPQLDIFGIDIFAPSLRCAAQRFAGQKCWFVQADACFLPFKQETFHTVISNQVIEHLANYEAYVSELNRVLVPGGMCLITTPNLKRPINIIRRHILRKPYQLRWQNWRGIPDEEYRGHRQEFTEEGLKNLMERHGLKVITIDGIYPKLSMKSSLLKIAYDTGIFAFWLACRLFKKSTSQDIVMVGRKS